jgi:hypothetical protein
MGRLGLGLVGGCTSSLHRLALSWGASCTPGELKLQGRAALPTALVGPGREQLGGGLGGLRLESLKATQFAQRLGGLDSPAAGTAGLGTASTQVTSARSLTKLAGQAFTPLKLNAGLSPHMFAPGSLSLGDYLFPKLELGTSRADTAGGTGAPSAGWHGVHL